METNRANRLDIRKTGAFRYTNDPWNELKLNLGWSIGLMMKIIGDRRFDTFAEWEKHYFETGVERAELLAKKPADIRSKLEDLRAPCTNPFRFKMGLTRDEIDLNESYGRTMEELESLAVCLFERINKDGNPFAMTLKDCITHVYIRVVDEIYVGIMREVNTLKGLERKYPNLTFKKADAETDRNYAVDAEIFNESGKLICGIQIKSSYFRRGKGKNMKQSMEQNISKNLKYQNLKNVPTYFVYAEVNGRIEDTDIYDRLDELVAGKEATV